MEDATRSLELGRRDTTDFLAVSFSSLDSVGHAFGPRSHEVQDALARIDRAIGRLLAMLDERVGRGNYVVAMSADHGVAPIPEQMAQGGASAGRMLSTEVVKTINDALATRFGPGAYVSSVSYTDVYFAPGVYARVRADPVAWHNVEGALAAMPGIARVLRSEEIAATTPTDDAVLRAARLSYFPGRSGDLVLVPRPYWILSSAAATHGTHYAYDARVPVIFYGAGVRAGRYWDRASPADVAPTLAALSGITMAVAEGRVLSSALAEPRRR
ncbi:MAG: alkaline phosphatase family protein [Vicinamibacterales bacterium]